MMSADLLKRDFSANAPAQKCVTDITEIKGRNGKLYISGIIDCFDTAVLGLAMDTNMKTPLCIKTLANACLHYPEQRNAIIHSNIDIRPPLRLNVAFNVAVFIIFAKSDTLTAIFSGAIGAWNCLAERRKNTTCQICPSFMP